MSETKREKQVLDRWVREDLRRIEEREAKKPEPEPKKKGGRA